MKLYTFDAAPNPLRLGLFMRYKGLQIDTQQLDMMQGEHRAADYLAINPEGTVPALLLDDGTLMTEVIGMCSYLEDLHPDKPLMGSSPLERAQVLSWDHNIYVSAMSGVAEVLRNRSAGFSNRALPGSLDLPQIPELAERGKLRIDHAWRQFDKALAGRDWLATDGPSLADIDLLVFAGFSGWVKQSIPENCSNLQAWHARAKATFEPD